MNLLKKRISNKKDDHRENLSDLIGKKLNIFIFIFKPLYWLPVNPAKLNILT